MGPMPERPARKDSSNCSTVLPMLDSTPTPVTTTRRIASGAPNFSLSAIPPRRESRLRSISFSRLGVLGAIEPFFRPFHVFKLQHNNALGMPIALKRFTRTTAHDIFSAIICYCRAREPFVFFVADGIGDLNFNNDVGWHDLPCDCDHAARNHNSFAERGLLAEVFLRKFHWQAADDCRQADCAPRRKSKSRNRKTLAGRVLRAFPPRRRRASPSETYPLAVSFLVGSDQSRRDHQKSVANSQPSHSCEPAQACSHRR